jgi:hypothetical protein
MDASANIPVSLGEAHRYAVDDANRWRGRMVNLFAYGEMVVGKALRLRSGSIRMPMLLSQRITKLIPLASKKASDALDEFAKWSDERNAIVHGVGKVYIDRSGKWLLSLQSVGRKSESVWIVAQCDAEAKDKALKLVVDRLSAAFRD